MQTGFLHVKDRTDENAFGRGDFELECKLLKEKESKVIKKRQNRLPQGNFGWIHKSRARLNEEATDVGYAKAEEFTSERVRRDGERGEGFV